MTNCTVKGCKNHVGKCNKKTDGVSYHRFPADPVRDEVWCRIVRQKCGDPYFKSNKHTRICSDHFSANYYYTTRTGLKKLKNTALPSIIVQRPVYAVSEYYSPVKIEHNTQVKIEDPSDVEIEDSSQVKVERSSQVKVEDSSRVKIESGTRKCSEEENVMEIDSSNLQSIVDTPREAALKRKMKKCMLRSLAKSKMVQNIKKQNDRLIKKMKSLNNTIKDLKKKLLITIHKYRNTGRVTENTGFELLQS